MVGLVLALLAGCWLTDGDLAEAAGRCEEGASAPTEEPPEPTTGPTGLSLAGIPAGSFCMGSEATEAAQEEAPLHWVTLTRSFWLSKTEVTQDQFATLMEGTRPSTNSGCGDCPVEGVTWLDAAAFANTASDAEELERCYSSEGLPEGNPYDCEGYRLPTEAEWEYAARAGEGHLYSGADDVAEVAWFSDNASETQDVRSLASNAWDVYDMSGNVWEWVGDLHDERYYASSTDSDPAGPEEGEARGRRGGSWAQGAAYSRVSNRFLGDPAAAADDVGFRLARTHD